MKLIEELLTKNQKELKEFLFEKMTNHGYDVTRNDAESGYLKCEFSNGHHSLLIAHLDTYNSVVPKRIVVKGNIIVGYDNENERCILGGDDRCGVYIILKLLENGYRPQVLFTEDEENGCLGAKAFKNNEEQFLEKIDYCIQIDRCINDNPDNYVDYDVSNEHFNKFIERLGFDIKMTGTSSDVKHIAPYLKIPGVNVCAGYHNEHGADEYINMEVVEKTYSKLQKIYENRNDNVVSYDYV